MDHRIVVKGDIDIAAAPDLLRRLDEAIDADPGGLVVVDFDAVTFIDSTGLGVLVAAQRRARTAGGTLGVVGVPDRVRQVFEVTGLDRVLLCPA